MRVMAGGDAIGVAVPGLVRGDGTLWARNLREWDRVPSGIHLAERSGIPRENNVTGCWLLVQLRPSDQQPATSNERDES